MARTSPTRHDEESPPCMRWFAASQRKRETNVFKSLDRRQWHLVTLLKEGIKLETTAMGDPCQKNSMISLIAAIWSSCCSLSLLWLALPGKWTSERSVERGHIIGGLELLRESCRFDHWPSRSQRLSSRPIRGHPASILVGRCLGRMQGGSSAN